MAAAERHVEFAVTVNLPRPELAIGFGWALACVGLALRYGWWVALIGAGVGLVIAGCVALGAGMLDAYMAADTPPARDVHHESLERTRQRMARTGVR